MELNDWQNQVDGLARELCHKLLDLGETMDLDPGLAIAAIPQAAAYCVVTLLINDDEQVGLMWDKAIVGHSEDFNLSIRKAVALFAPHSVSDEFKLETGRIDRALKRRREMPNAPEPGDA